jgi:transposase
LFVAVLGASNYTYAETTQDQQMASWIGAHVRTFEFLGGCPQLVVPVNTRTGVSRACRYEPDLNPTYQEMAMHYAVGGLPTRPRKPRDKAKVEVGVQIVQRWIVAALRHRKFFSLGELNRAIRELLDKLNQRPFQWAAKVGTRTQEVVEKILQAQPHPEMGYRSCLGIIRLGQRYPPARVEAAADRALLTGAVSYRSMDSILRRNLDQPPLNPPPATRSRPEHDNIRGAAYFE